MDLETKHNQAIRQEVGERLRILLRPESSMPSRLRRLLDRLHEVVKLSEASPSIVPDRGSEVLKELAAGRRAFIVKGA